MTKHIIIPFITDFYLKITRINPDIPQTGIVQKSIAANRKSFNEQDLKENLKRVNMWISNCDQKASFVLAMLGVGITILFTSDFVKYVRKTIIAPFKTYLCDNIQNVDWLKCAVALSLIYVCIGVIITFYHLVNSLRAKTDINRFAQQGIERKSMLHYEAVANMTYNEFCTSEVHIINDLRSQVYINSIICTAKFRHYKKAIKALFYTIPGVILLLSLILFA